VKSAGCGVWRCPGIQRHFGAAPKRNTEACFAAARAAGTATSRHNRVPTLLLREYPKLLLLLSFHPLLLHTFDLWIDNTFTMSELRYDGQVVVVTGAGGGESHSAITSEREILGVELLDHVC
jgi:hypothetical protein